MWGTYEDVNPYEQFSVKSGSSHYELQKPKLKQFRRKVLHKSSEYRIFRGTAIRGLYENSMVHRIIPQTNQEFYCSKFS